MWLKRQCAVYNNVKRSGSRRKQNEPKVLMGESQRFQSKLNFTQGCTSTQHLTLICSEPRKTEHQHHHHHPAKSTLYALRVSCIGESHLSGNTHAKKKKKKKKYMYILSGVLEKNMRPFQNDYLALNTSAAELNEMWTSWLSELSPWQLSLHTKYVNHSVLKLGYGHNPGETFSLPPVC